MKNLILKIHTYISNMANLIICFFKIQNTKESLLEIPNLIELALTNSRNVIVPVQFKSELVSLLTFVKNYRPNTIMEIGTASGGTLFLLSRVASNEATILSIDLPRGGFGGGYGVWRIPLYKSFAGKKQNIYLIRKNSHDEQTLKKVRLILADTLIDLLFIDGDHTYKGVKKDFELYSQLVIKGGIIAFHDIVPHPPETVCEVDKFWDEIKQKYEHIEFVEDWKQNKYGIGIIKI
jgi:predicted O-methyltransferase YrrM